MQYTVAQPTTHGQQSGNILMIAYACEPGATSEPGVGWNLAHVTAKYYPITVLTRSNNKEAIEKAGNATSAIRSNIRWEYVDLSQSLQWLKKKLPFGTQMYYILWQWKAFMYARRLHRLHNYSITHHLTFGVSWLAPPAALLRTMLVWGPIGGGDLVPEYIMKHETPLNRIKEFAYGALVFLAYRLSPISHIARKRSAAIIFRNRSTQENFPHIEASKAYVICETAADSSRPVRQNQNEGGLSAVCVGRMQYWKGFIYAVEGFHRYIQFGGKGNLTLLGDGPDFNRIQQYCRKHKLENQVTLLGKVSSESVQKHLREANVLIHPSFRDGGSWAVLEAMTNGLPIIAVNHSGSADMVNNEIGYCITSHSKDELIEMIAHALGQLDSNPDLRFSMGKASQSRAATDYQWASRGRSLKAIYDKLLQVHS